MADRSSQASSDQEAAVAIEIVPLEEEEDDFDTLAAVGRVHADIQREAAQLKGVSVTSLPTGERGLDIIVLITLAGASIAASKDLLTSIFNMVTAAIDLLAKRARVQEIEIIAGGKTLILRDLTKKTAKELIEAFEMQHPGAMTKLTTGTTVKVKAKISKKSRAKQ